MTADASPRDEESRTCFAAEVLEYVLHATRSARQQQKLRPENARILCESVDDGKDLGLQRMAAAAKGLLLEENGIEEMMLSILPPVIPNYRQIRSQATASATGQMYHIRNRHIRGHTTDTHLQLTLMVLFLTS